MFLYKTLTVFSFIISLILSVNLAKNGEGSDGKVSVPLKTLMSITQECPRLQELGTKLLNDKDYCDINLEVSDQSTGETRRFCAHKCILCLRSDVLKEKIKQMVSTGPAKPVLKLPNMSAGVFKNVLRFIYTDKIDSNFDLRHNILDLYSIADFLGLKELKVMIEDHFYGNTRMEDIPNYLDWAKRHKYVKIQKFVLEYARNILKMSEADWNLFVQFICISAGYTQEESNQLLNEITPPPA